MYFTSSSITLLSLSLLATTALANPSFPLRRQASNCKPVIDPNVCQFLPGIGEVDPNNHNNCLFSSGPDCDCRGLNSPSGICAVAVCSGTNSYFCHTVGEDDPVWPSTAGNSCDGECYLCEEVGCPNVITK